jgi:hypothetical protein
MSRLSSVMPVALAVALVAGCKTADNAASAVKDAGSSVADAAGHSLDGAVSLVNVNLSNVLNNLALDLHVDKANVPINAQIPITLAANICGVSINILSASGGAKPNCTATTTSPALDQAVQQQLAANGSVGGGSQSTSGNPGTTAGITSTITTDKSGTPTTTTTAPTSGTPATGTPAPTTGGQ